MIGINCGDEVDVFLNILLGNEVDAFPNILPGTAVYPLGNAPVFKLCSFMVKTYRN